jgi:hypothetical protein
MKQLMLILVCSLCFFSFTDNSVKLKKDKVDQTKKIIESVAAYVDQSNLPHQEVIQLEKQLKIAYDNLTDSTK